MAHPWSFNWSTGRPFSTSQVQNFCSFGVHWQNFENGFERHPKFTRVSLLSSSSKLKRKNLTYLMTNKWIFGYIEPKYQFMYPKWTKKEPVFVHPNTEGRGTCDKILFTFIPFQPELSWKQTLLQQMCFQGQPICKLLYLP